MALDVERDPGNDRHTATEPKTKALFIEKAEAHSVFVYDETGRVVYENKASGSFSINTTNWSRGIYFIKASSDTGVITKRIVKQ